MLPPLKSKVALKPVPGIPSDGGSPLIHCFVIKNSLRSNGDKSTRNTDHAPGLETRPGLTMLTLGALLSERNRRNTFRRVL